MQRVLLYVNTFPKLSETFIVSKFLGLLDLGYDVHIVCRQSSPEGWSVFPSLRAVPNVQARIHVQPPTSPRVATIARYPGVILNTLVTAPSTAVEHISTRGQKAAREFYHDAIALRLKPDIIHIEFGATAHNILHLKEILGCKIVVSFRGYDLNFVGLEDPNHYAGVWEGADWLHLLGDDLWQRALRRGCPPDKPHTFVPPAIDTSFFKPNATKHEQAEGEPLVITSVGRLEWKKGYEFAMDALALLKQAGVNFTYQIIGDGSDFNAVAYAAYQCGIKENVHFLRSMPRTEVRQVLNKTDIFLHTAVSEGFSNAVLEAQAMELPIVTSDADGLSENVADGVTGFVVPRRDAAATAEKLHLLAKDPALRRKMGTAGRKRVQENYELADQAPQFAAIYEGLKEGNIT